MRMSLEPPFTNRPELPVTFLISLPSITALVDAEEVDALLAGAVDDVVDRRVTLTSGRP